MTKGVHDIDIFVRDIDTARISDVAVYNADFLMISIIQIKIVDDRLDFIKHRRLDPRLLCNLFETFRQTGDAAEIIVQDPHIYPRGGLLLQNLKQLLPQASL